MSQHRVSAIAVALAAGLAVVSAPDSFAATIQGDGSARCPINYTDAERKSTYRVEGGVFVSRAVALAKGYDAVFAGARRVLADFRNEPAVIRKAKADAAYLGAPSDQKPDTYDEVLNNQVAALETRYQAELVKLGVSKDAAKELVWGVLPAITTNDPQMKSYAFLEAAVPNANPKRPTRDEEVGHLFKVEDKALTAEQRAKIEQVLRDDRRLNQAADLAYANRQAVLDSMVACAKGGTHNVAWPTTVLSEPNWYKDSPLDGSSDGSSDGEQLSPGAIAGIVVGVLALLAIAGVAAAPMLGIPLPFELPALPF